MLKRIKSIIDGNSLDVIKLKVRRRFSYKNLNLIKNNVKIPIIINNRDRLYHLKKLLDYLESKNINEILIIDNQSTYLPLIDFYKKTNYKIYRMQKNLGYLSLYGKQNCIINTKKIIMFTLILIFFQQLNVQMISWSILKNCLLNNKGIEKVGFGLKIDDLPENENKKNIISFEKKFLGKKGR